MLRSNATTDAVLFSCGAVNWSVCCSRFSAWPWCPANICSSRRCPSFYSWWRFSRAYSTIKRPAGKLTWSIAWWVSGGFIFFCKHTNLRVLPSRRFRWWYLGWCRYYLSWWFCPRQGFSTLNICTHWSILASWRQILSCHFFETNSNGHFVVNYDDGDVEILDLSTETWRPCSVIPSNLASFPSLQSNLSLILQVMLNALGQKRFSFHHAQGFP